MSYQLPPNAAPLEDNDDYSSSSGSDTTECDNFSNWAEDPEDASALAVPLFGQPGEQVQNVQQAMEIDRSKGFDLEREVERLGLDFHQRVRLINHIRKTTPSVETVAKLTGTEKLFQDDSLLIPVLENDAYLQVGDSWDSDSDEDLDAPSQPQSSSVPNSQTPKESDAELQKARRKIRSLEDKIKALQAEAQYELGSLKNILKDRMNASNGVESREVEVKDGAEGEGKKVNEEGKGKGKERDDDSHYFDSYAYNDMCVICLS
ncbi:Protein arginine N-methyltransferase PRMT1 and related enzymes [Phaffia rhodozyma]|uniref:type I protein arginine methyltransferase n=1 Tax=Phaffia rhodozyma TaxID=264483 RepID=A0A0F7SRX4_PHARH|nr:Protein arginine N-methyltransferase PRMT1 and related enzymes [Phaffia rhodozyma]